jgi:GNAT superfamily N-acetyltransferase
MSVSIRKFKTYPMPEAEAEELASVCRGQFSADEIAKYEDWSYLLTYRASPDGPLQAFLLLDTESELPDAVVRVVCAKDKGTQIPQYLFKWAEKLARSEKAKTLTLELLSHDEKLRAVYEGLGFTLMDPLSRTMQKPLRKGASRVKKQTRRTQRKRRNTVRR